MGGKEERQRMINGGSIPWHSLNQAALKTIRDREQKVFGNSNKAVKAERRRREKQEVLEDQQFGMDLLQSRRRMQLNRALEHVFVKKSATLQEMDYITQKGKVLERFTIPEGIEDPEVLEELPEVIITIVDFTPPNSNKLS